MKGFSRLFLIVMAATALFVSACGAAPSGRAGDDGSVGSAKPLASLIPISGTIGAIDGNMWTIDGQVVIMDPSMLDDDDWSKYQVGDFIELEVEVLADGSVVARRIGSKDDGNENDDDSNSNANANSNDDSNANGNSNDDDNSNSKSQNSNSGRGGSNSNNNGGSNSNDDDNSDDDDNDDDNDNDD